MFPPPFPLSVASLSVQVIGGVVLASVKELDFAWSALITACLANLFAAFKVCHSRCLCLCARPNAPYVGAYQQQTRGQGV